MKLLGEGSSPEGTPRNLMTAPEVAELLRMSLKAVYNESGPGGLLAPAAVRIGPRRLRYRRGEIEKLL